MGEHCNTKSFILQSKKSICSYIQYHIPPFKYIFVMFTKEKTILKLFTRTKRGGNSLNTTNTKCNQQLHSDRNELAGESQTKWVTGTQVSILN